MCVFVCESHVMAPPTSCSNCCTACFAVAGHHQQSTLSQNQTRGASLCVCLVPLISVYAACSTLAWMWYGVCVVWCGGEGLVVGFCGVPAAAFKLCSGS